jgi:hypothetical protein
MKEDGYDRRAECDEGGSAAAARSSRVFRTELNPVDCPSESCLPVCWDQLVVSGRRADLDVDLVALRATGSLVVKLDLMRRIGEREMPGERAAVPAREFARVKHRRGHVRLRTSTRRPANTESIE